MVSLPNDQHIRRRGSQQTCITELGLMPRKTLRISAGNPWIPDGWRMPAKVIFISCGDRDQSDLPSPRHEDRVTWERFCQDLHTDRFPPFSTAGVASASPMIAIGLDDGRAQGLKRHLVMQKSKDKDGRDERPRSSHLPGGCRPRAFSFHAGNGIRAIFQVRDTKTA